MTCKPDESGRLVLSQVLESIQLVQIRWVRAEVDLKQQKKPQSEKMI